MLHQGAPGGLSAALHLGAPAAARATGTAAKTVHTSVRGGSEITMSVMHVSVIHLSFLPVYNHMVHALLMRAAAPIVVTVSVIQ